MAAFQFQNGAFGSVHPGYLMPTRGSDDWFLAFRGLDGVAVWPNVGASRAAGDEHGA